MTNYLIMYTIEKLEFNVPESDKPPHAYFNLLSMVCNSTLWDNRKLFANDLNGVVCAVSNEFVRLLKVFIRNKELSKYLLDCYDPDHIICFVSGGYHTTKVEAGEFAFIHQDYEGEQIKLELPTTLDTAEAF